MDNRTWHHYSLMAGEGFDNFWKSYFSEKKGTICYVMATGFDPRAYSCLSKFVDGLIPTAEFIALLIHLNYQDYDKQLLTSTESNTGEIKKIISGWSHQEETVNLAVAERPGAGAGAVRILARKFFEDNNPDHIVIDMNAMPKNLVLSIIEMALRYNRDSRDGNVNVHVVVTHNPALDEAIQNVEVQEDAFPLPGMLSDVVEEGQDNVARIWIPILGKGCGRQLRAIHDSYRPHEICPVVPNPSNNPRLADELIVEHQQFLKVGDRLVPKNVLRISENNPFEAYEEILGTISEYAKSYANLGGCIVYLSTHASKLLSLAALLAADDSRTRGICSKVTLVFVESRAHRLGHKALPPGMPYTMWIAGEPFLISAEREDI